jgi:hypothetical protein
VQDADGVSAFDVDHRYEFAEFARELDALRLRMLSASFYERVGDMAQRGVSGDRHGRVQVSARHGDERGAVASIQDAITSAVLSLETHHASGGEPR